MDEDKLDLEELNKLEWIRIRGEVFDEIPFYGSESRFIRKIKQNPWVPLGFLATAGCVFFGIRDFVKRKSHTQQMYMRGRILAQGFTLAACAVGLGVTVLAYKSNQPSSNDKLATDK